MALLTKLQEQLRESASDPEDIPPPFPRVVVESWGATAVHATLYILCRVQPSFDLQLMRKPNGMYDAHDVAGILLHMVMPYHKTQENLQEMWDFLLKHCVESDQDSIIGRAEGLGFETSQVQDKLATGPARLDSRIGLQPTIWASGHPPSGGSLASGASRGRRLGRMNTDEELASLVKRQKLIEIKKALRQEEALAVQAESHIAESAARPQAPSAQER